MGLLQRFKSAFKAFGMTSADLERMLIVGGTTTSGVSVTVDTAMRQETVFSCINILSRSVSQLPCHLYKQAGPSKDKASEHRLYPLLHDQPNEWMTAPEFWGMCMAHLSGRGNFFALKNRGLSLTGPVRELIPLAPGIVQEVKQDKNYQLAYHCTFPDGTQKDIPGREIMHLRGLTLNGYMGVNPIEYVRESIGLAVATREFGARYFGSGTHPGMIVEHPGKVSKQASENLKSSLSDAYSGLGKAHRLMLLEEGMKATPITINPQDSQFLETRKYQRADIVDIFFAMPLTVMSNGEKSMAYASSEQFSLEYVTYALAPWLVNIEKGIKRDLLTDEEKKSYYAKFQVAALLRGDMKSRFEAYQIGINTEIINPNEARDLEDMNPYKGGEIYKTRTSSMKEPVPGKKDGA